METVEAAFAAELHDLADAGEQDVALDLVMDQFDSWLSDGDYDICDQCMSMLDVPRLGIDIVVGVLSITRAAKTRLRKRAALCAALRTFVRKSAPEREAAIFDGLI